MGASLVVKLRTADHDEVSLSSVLVAFILT